MMAKFKERILFMALGAVFMLGLLVLLAWFWGRTPTAIAKTTAQLMAYRAATTNFFAMTGRWPTSATELVRNSMGVIFIVPSPPVRDAWNHEIIYESYDAIAGHGRIVSYGRDGKAGGVGADADLEQRFP